MVHVLFIMQRNYLSWTPFANSGSELLAKAPTRTIVALLSLSDDRIDYNVPWRARSAVNEADSFNNETHALHILPLK